MLQQTAQIDRLLSLNKDIRPNLKNMQNPRKYANNWRKLTSVKSQTPTPGHKR